MHDFTYETQDSALKIATDISITDIQRKAGSHPEASVHT